MPRRKSKLTTISTVKPSTRPKKEVAAFEGKKELRSTGRPVLHDSHTFRPLNGEGSMTMVGRDLRISGPNGLGRSILGNDPAIIGQVKKDQGWIRDDGGDVLQGERGQ